MRPLILLLSIASSASSLASPEPAITGNGIGPIRIGMSATDAKSQKYVVSDKLEPNSEGGKDRVLKVRIGTGVVTAEVDKGRIWRIAVRSSAPRTPDGFGVGTRLTELLREPGWTGALGEGNLFVWNKKYCGLSFELDFDPHAAPTTTPEWVHDHLAKLPSRTQVQSVLILGCTR